MTVDEHSRGQGRPLTWIKAMLLGVLEPAWLLLRSIWSKKWGACSKGRAVLLRLGIVMDKSAARCTG